MMKVVGGWNYEDQIVGLNYPQIGFRMTGGR